MKFLRTILDKQHEMFKKGSKLEHPVVPFPASKV
jgi:hypothetical protein